MSAASAFADTGAVVFDAYGTLFNVAAAVERCRAALGDTADALSALWRSKQLEYCWLRSLRGDYVDFWHVTGESLDYALASFALDDPALRSRLMELYLVLDAYPDGAAALAALKQAGLRLAILSNGSPTMLTAAVAGAALTDALDAVISVDGIGVYKPHPRVYQLAVDRLGLPAARIGFVSANYWDVSGAALFGFRSVWINRTGALPDPLPGKPLARIDTLEALPAILGLDVPRSPA